MSQLVLWAVRRFRWVALGVVLKAATRWFTSSSIDSATADLEDRLPSTVHRAIKAAPGDLARVGGTAIVAGSTAKHGVAKVTKKASQVGYESGRRAATVSSSVNGKIRSTVEAVSNDLRQQTEQERRNYRADYLRQRGDHAAADDALLDIRTSDESHRSDPFAEVAGPTATGRRRGRHQVKPLVDRVQRTYRRTTSAWDRPLRSGPGRNR